MLTQERSLYQVAACRRFPLSGAVGNIRGDGRYAIVLKCWKRWKVLLYATPEERDAKFEEWRQQCFAGIDCRMDHAKEDIHL